MATGVNFIFGTAHDRFFGNLPLIHPAGSPRHATPQLPAPKSGTGWPKRPSCHRRRESAAAHHSGNEASACSGPSPTFSEHTDTVGTSAIDGHVVRSRHAVTEPDCRPPAGHIHETAAQLFATGRIRCDPACAARSEGTRRAYTGTNLPKSVRKHGAVSRFTQYIRQVPCG